MKKLKIFLIVFAAIFVLSPASSANAINFSHISISASDDYSYLGWITDGATIGAQNTIDSFKHISNLIANLATNIQNKINGVLDKAKAVNTRVDGINNCWFTEVTEGNYKKLKIGCTNNNGHNNIVFKCYAN